MWTIWSKKEKPFEMGFKPKPELIDLAIASKESIEEGRRSIDTFTA